MKTIQFPRWAEVLGASDLTKKERESYRVTLRWYLGWCHRHGVGCCVESARDFIEWAQAEKQANEWMLERWREPIRWFFAMAKAQTAHDLINADCNYDPDCCLVFSKYRTAYYHRRRPSSFWSGICTELKRAFFLDP